MTDLRIAGRVFLLRPGFAAAVVLTLAIGLGSATAIFAVVYALLLRPLPFPEADRIVAIQAEVSGAAGRLALREIRDLERDARTLARIGAYYRTQYNLTGGGPPEALTCTMPSSGVFDVLGIDPVYGDIWPASLDFTRQFTVVLSHHLWRQRFGARPDIVGESIVMDGTSYRVTGVLPPGIDFPIQTDVYRAITDYDAAHVRRYSAVARIADGRRLDEVQQELDAMASAFAAAWPDTNRGVRFRAVPLREAFVGGARPFVLLVAGGVALILLISSVNVTNLLLSRALSRQGDHAVRLALGASRADLVRQSTAEALLLALAGAALGAGGASYALDALRRVIGADLPPWLTVEIDPVTLLASAALAVVLAVAIGLLPALQAAGTDIERVLRQESGRGAGSGAQRAARRWLVGAQAAVAALLLVMAGLFATGLSALWRTEVGFEPVNTFTFRTDPPFSRYGDIATTSEFYRRTAEMLEQIPGVESVGTNNNLPFARLGGTSPRVVVDGSQSGRADEEPFVNFQIVGPGYFDAMGIERVAGRGFLRTDVEGAPPVVVISDRVARRFWGDADPIGRRLRVTWNQHGVAGGGGDELALTVVGVVRAVRFAGVDDETGLDVYAPNTQLFAGDSFFVLRAAGDAASLTRQVRAAMDVVDPEQSLFDVQTMDGRIAKTLWQHRVSAAVLVTFAGIALLLAVVGTYAVTAHAVAAQRREIGIRLALGSTAPAVGWIVARAWLTPVAVGAAVGMTAGVVAARQLAVLIGTAVETPVWPFALPVVLAAAGALACWLPVARLLRQVPLTEALRAQ